MRLLKSLAIITLSSLIGFSLPAVAKTSGKTERTQLENTDKQLKRFNSSIAVRFNGFDITTAENNQKVVNFKYIIQNISRKSISKVEWVSIYLHQNTLILSQDVPVTFKKLMPKKQQNLVFSIPLDKLSPIAQQVFSSKNKIDIIFQAKAITFTDKSKIVVE